MNEFSIYLGSTKVKIRLTENGTAFVDGKDHSFELVELNPGNYILKVDNRVHHIHCFPDSADIFQIDVDGHSYELTVRTALQERAAELIGISAFKGSRTEIKAPMPGMVLKINKAAKQAVNQGEPVMILEAMKMENELRSPASGIITDIFVQEGFPVEKGALLYIIE